MPSSTQTSTAIAETAFALFLLATFLVLSLILLSSPGTGDVASFLHWGDEARRSGLVAGFMAITSRFDETTILHHWDAYGGEYPPLGIALLDAGSTVAAKTGASPLIIFKLSLLAFALASAIAIAAATGRLLDAAVFYAVTVLGTFGLGYTDIMTVPLLVGALVAVRSERPALATGLFVIDALIKWQVLLLAPFLFIQILRIDGVSSMIKALASQVFWRVTLTAAVIVAGATAWFGTATWVALSNATRHPFLSGNALNLPWIATYILRLMHDPSFGAGDEIHYLLLEPPGLLPFRLVFFVVFASVLVAAIKAEKSFRNMLFFMVLGVLTYGIWNTAVHENHWFVALVPASLLAAETCSATSRRIFVLVCVMLNLNLFVFYGVTGTPLAQPVAGFDLTLLLAILFVVAWLAMSWLAWSAVVKASQAGRRYQD